MKKKFLFLITLQLLAAIELNAQHDTLAPVQVVDSNARQFIGQNVIRLNLEALIPLAQAPLADRIENGTPLVLSGPGYGLVSNPSLRGNRAEGTQVFWNGLPLNSPLLGSSDLNMFSSLSYQQVAVVPGGNGAEMGSGAMGGSILLNDHINFSEGQKLKASAALGSFGQFSAGMGYQHSSNNQHFSVATEHRQANNDYSYLNPYGEEAIRENSALSQYAFSSSYARKLAAAELSSHLLTQNLHRQIPASSIRANASAPETAYEDDQQWRWQNVLKTKGWHLEQGFSLEYQHYVDAKSNIDSRNDFFLSASEIRKVILTKGSLSWDGGGYLNYYRAFGSNVKEQQAEYGLRSGLSYQPSKDFVTRISLSQDFVDERPVALLPTLGAEYDLHKNWQLKARFNGVFNNPTLNQRYWPGGGNADILPEHGYNAEIGLRYRYHSDDFFLSNGLTAYTQNIRDKIIWNTVGGIATAENEEQVRSYGLEELLQFNWRLSALSRINGSVSAVYTDARVISSGAENTYREGKQLIYVPRFSSTGSFSYHFKMLSFYLSGRYNSGSYTTTDNDALFKLDDFWLWDTGLGYELRINKLILKPAVVVRNVFNTDYSLYAYNPMPGINFQFNLNSTFAL